MTTRLQWEEFNRNVFEALYANLANVPSFPPLDRRGHENVRFDPPKDRGAWAKIAFGPGPRGPVGLGKEALHRADGTFFIDVFTDANQGTDASLIITGQLESAYTSETDLISSSGQIVHIKRCYASRPLPPSGDGAFSQVPVTVEWWAEIFMFAHSG